jgi:hypothetical protein
MGGGICVKLLQEEMNLHFQENALFTCVNCVPSTPWLFSAFGKSGRFIPISKTYLK